MDLNSDLGEGFGEWQLGDDEAMLDVITSANIVPSIAMMPIVDHQRMLRWPKA